MVIPELDITWFKEDKNVEGAEEVMSPCQVES